MDIVKSIIQVQVLLFSNLNILFIFQGRTSRPEFFEKGVKEINTFIKYYLYNIFDDMLLPSCLRI